MCWLAAAHSHACFSSGHAKVVRAASKVGVIHEDDDIAFNSSSKGIGLLCAWAVCRAKGEPFDRHWRPNEPYVKVRLKVGTSSQQMHLWMSHSRLSAASRSHLASWRHLLTVGTVARSIKPCSDRKVSDLLCGVNGIYTCSGPD